MPLIGREQVVERLTAIGDRPPLPGFLLVGPAGVGKSRLLSEVSASVMARRVSIVRVVGLRSGQDIPLAAFAAYTPQDRPDDLTASWMVHATFDRIRQLQRGRRLVAIVDDVDLIDPASETVLSLLVQHADCRLLAAARSRARLPESLARLMVSRRMERVELSGLGNEDVHRLLEVVLDGNVDVGSAWRLGALSRGNPLYLREIVAESVKHGHLTRSAGVWTLTGQPMLSASLEELLSARIAHLDEATRRALEDIAELELASLQDVLAWHPTAAVGALEEAGLVSVDPSGAVANVRVSHPVIGEVVRARTSRASRIGLARRMAGRFDQDAPRAPQEALRLCRVRRRAGLPVGATPGLMAAIEAYRSGQPRLAEDLLHEVMEQRPDSLGRLLLAQLLHDRGDHDGSEQLLATLDVRQLPVEHRVQYWLVRSDNLFFGLGKAAQAVEMLAQAALDLSPSPQLDANRAWILVECGAPVEALDALDRTRRERQHDDHTDASTLVPVSIVRAQALRMTGDIRRATSALDDVTESPGRMYDETDIRSMTFPQLVKVGCLIDDGDLARARAMIGDVFESRLGLQPAYLQARWLEARANLLLRQGHVGAAGADFSRAASIQHRLGQQELERRSSIMELLCRLQAGDRVSSPDRDGLMRPSFARGDDIDRSIIATSVHRTRGWLLARTGRWHEALTEMRHGLDRARAAELRILEAEMLHDLVRLDLDLDVAERLGQLSEETTSTAVALFHRSAVAAELDEPARLQHVAAEFERLGWLLAAAEHYARAVEASSGSDSGQVASWRSKADVLARHCGRPATPWLNATAPVAGLTPREVEVTRLAGAGESNAGIAEILGISPRTVENHLYRAYRKLGVDNRADAAELLRLRGTGPGVASH